MNQANLEVCTWIDSTNTGDTVEYWDNKRTDLPTLLMVHGFGASTKYQFSKQVKLLSEHYRLILPNLYHFGNTRPGTKKYSVEDQVALLQNLMHQLELESYTLCGVSYGGLISIELAHKSTDDIDKLILFDAPIKFMDSSDLNSVKSYFNVSSVEELFVPEDPKGLRKLIYLATGKKYRLPKIMLKEFHHREYLNNLEDKRQLISSLIADLEYYQQRDYDINLPVLLIWGENDKVVPADRGQLLKEYLGDSTNFYIIPNSAHMPNMTKPRTFNKIIRDFLEI